MCIIRPVTPQDLPGLIDLAASAGPGMASIREDQDLLERKIGKSLSAFEHEGSEPHGGTYLFLLVHADSKEIWGTSGLKRTQGFTHPAYFMKRSSHTRHCSVMGIDRTFELLDLVEKNKGPSEICDLYLHKTKRNAGWGFLLSASRLLFLADFADRFHPVIRADMRGVIEKGDSPFWEEFGHRLYGVGFNQAIELNSQDRRFLPELFPECPVYVDLLSHRAQELIGKVNDSTYPALQMLLQQGFKMTDEVSVFDAGPQLETRVDELKIHTTSRVGIVGESHGEDGISAIISNRRLKDFRACKAKVQLDGEHILVPSKTMQSLEVTAGDSIRILAKEHQ